MFYRQAAALTASAHGKLWNRSFPPSCLRSAASRESEGRQTTQIITTSETYGREETYTIKINGTFHLAVCTIWGRLTPVKGNINKVYASYRKSAQYRIWIESWNNCRLALWMIEKPPWGLRNKEKSLFHSCSQSGSSSASRWIPISNYQGLSQSQDRTFLFLSCFRDKGRSRARWPDADLHFWKTLKCTFSFIFPSEAV